MKYELETGKVARLVVPIPQTRERACPEPGEGNPALMFWQGKSAGSLRRAKPARWSQTIVLIAGQFYGGAQRGVARPTAHPDFVVARKEFPTVLRHVEH